MFIQRTVTNKIEKINSVGDVGLFIKIREKDLTFLLFLRDFI